MNYLFSLEILSSVTCTVQSPHPRPNRVLSFIFEPTVCSSSQSGQLYMQQQAFCVTSTTFLLHLIVSILLNRRYIALPCDDFFLFCFVFWFCFSYLNIRQCVSGGQFLQDYFGSLVFYRRVISSSSSLITQVIWISVCLLALRVSTAFF